MSRLLVVTRPSLAAGFQLAGVEAFAAEDEKAAQDIIAQWLDSEEINLLAVDDGLLAQMEPIFLKRLDSAENLPYVSIPGGQPLGPEATYRHRIAQMIRRAVGFHITFKEEEEMEPTREYD